MKFSSVITLFLTKTILVNAFTERTERMRTHDVDTKTNDEIDANAFLEARSDIKTGRYDLESPHFDVRPKRERRNLAVTVDMGEENDENDISYLMRGCLCTEETWCTSLNTFVTSANMVEELRMCFWSDTRGLHLASIDTMEIVFVDTDGSLLILPQDDDIVECDIDTQGNLCTAQVDLQGAQDATIGGGVILARGKAEFVRPQYGEKNIEETSDFNGFTEFDIFIPTKLSSLPTDRSNTGKSTHSYVIVTAVTIGGLAALVQAVNVTLFKLNQWKRNAKVQATESKEELDEGPEGGVI